MKTTRQPKSLLGGHATSQKVGVAGDEICANDLLDRPTYLQNMGFPIEVGIDTIRVFIRVNSKKSPWWYTQTCKRKAVSSYGKDGDSYDKAQWKHLRCGWVPMMGSTVECSVPKLLGKLPTSLAYADELPHALELIEEYMIAVADPAHIIPPRATWTFSRTDFAIQFQASNSDRLVCAWLALAGKGNGLRFAAQHGSGKIVGTTLKLRLYDKLVEQGEPTLGVSTLMRLEIETLGSGLRRINFPFERNLEGIINVLQRGVPRLLQPELNHLRQAMDLIAAEATYPEIVSLCSSPSEKALVWVILDTFPSFSLKDRLKRIPRNALSAPVRKSLKALSRVETRSFSPLHTLPGRAKP